MPRKSPPKKPTGIPASVEQGAVLDFAKGNGRPGTLEAICSAWQLTEQQARAIRGRNRGEINELRLALSNTGFEVAAHLLGEIAKDLNNEEKMLETPLRDKAMSYEKVIGASVTAADGHKPDIRIDFGSLRLAREELMQRDERQKEMRKAREAEVV